MNRLIITGNLVKDPELRTTTSGKNVCSFTVAVNRRKRQPGEEEADFFEVSAWNGLADVCAKYLAKGRKVAVVGSVSIHKWESQNGKTGARLQVTADDVEFLSSRTEQPRIDEQSKMQIVEPDEMPY